jgi:molybdate transport system substrate-binding protein
MAIEKTLQEFQAREGIELDVAYNGCGVLVTMMNGGSQPDVYFACDSSYMTQVDELFEPSRDVSETAMVIITPKGNPENVQSLEDLSRSGLRVGFAHENKSALGKLTKDLLIDQKLYDAVRPQVKVEPNTADFLVNQLRTGALDAAIVYRANVSQVEEFVEVIPISKGPTLAVQPIAVSTSSPHKHLAGRLVSALLTEKSQERFALARFRWRASAETP